MTEQAEQKLNELTETEMKMAIINQRSYIREGLKGSPFFYQKSGFSKEDLIDELQVEVTPYGFNKAELDKSIEEKNAAMELLAIETDTSDDFYDNELREGMENTDNALKSLEEKMEFLRTSNQIEPEADPEEPLTEHEEVLQKLDEIKKQNALANDYTRAKTVAENLESKITNWLE